MRLEIRSVRASATRGKGHDVRTTGSPLAFSGPLGACSPP